MTIATSRRRVLRPTPPSTINPRFQAQREWCHRELVRERKSLRRWMSRLKRAFTAVAKHQNRLARIERKLAQLNGG